MLPFTGPHPVDACAGTDEPAAPTAPGPALTVEVTRFTVEPPTARIPYALEPAPVVEPDATTAFCTVTLDAPLTRMPVAWGPVLPVTFTRSSTNADVAPETTIPAGVVPTAADPACTVIAEIVVGAVTLAAMTALK